MLFCNATGTILFPILIDTEVSMAVEKADALQPYFQLQIPAILDVIAALVSSFVIGIGIALYIAMDSFGTACNVTGDGALAVIIDRLHREKNAER